jgi:hypothetical protein
MESRTARHEVIVLYQSGPRAAGNSDEEVAMEENKNRAAPKGKDQCGGETRQQSDWNDGHDSQSEQEQESAENREGSEDREQRQQDGAGGEQKKSRS